jgi:predicted metal-binding membrane protein
MAVLLVIGIMDLRAMAVVAAIITVERLARTVSAWHEASGPSWPGQVCF